MRLRPQWAEKPWPKRNGAEPAPWRDPIKNREIKKRFAVEGEKISGVKAYPSVKFGHKQWLYDLSWRVFDSSDNQTGVRLAMEIEFSDQKLSGLMFDFNKLLQADSDYKIFVFRQATEELVQQKMERFQAALRSYTHKSKSDFLIAGWSSERARFSFFEFHP